MTDTRKQLNRFLVDIFHNVLRREGQYLREAGYGDLSISEMHVIEACMSGEQGAKGIADLLQITPGSLTAAVKVLEKKGYLRRDRDPDDQRRIHIIPTAQALNAEAAHRRIHEQLIDEVLHQLSDGEAQLLLAALRGVTLYFGDERKSQT
ncbi:MAG: MarR family winged helix-turn-helix transcriptional regulator [Christensenellales bacterium]